MSEEVEPEMQIHRYSLSDDEGTLSPFDHIEVEQNKTSSHKSKPFIDPKFKIFLFKIFNFVASGFLIVVMLMSYFNRALFISEDDPYYFYIMTFQYNSTRTESEEPYSYNITSFYYALEADSVAIVIIVFAIILLVVTFFYFLLTASDAFYKHLYSNDLAKCLPLIFVLISIPFGLPLFSPLGNTLTIICLSFYAVSFFITVFMYFNTRKEILASYKVMIIQNILLSILLSFQLYYILFCVSSLSYENNGRTSRPTPDQSNLVIFLSVLYFCVGMALLTTYKDIIFSLVLVVIDLGILLSVSGKSLDETVTMFTIILFMFGGDILFVFKHKATLLWYSESKIEMETQLSFSEQNTNLDFDGML